MFPGLTGENAAALHALWETREDLGRAGAMLQRLCGIHPVVLSPGAKDLVRPMPRERVAEILSVSPDEVDLSISLLQQAWGRLVADSDKPVVIEPGAAAQKPKPDPTKQNTFSGQKIQFTVDQMSLLELGGFSTTIFDYPQSDYDKMLEVEWFCERIREVKKVFDEPMAKLTARSALLNQLHLRRINDKIVNLMPDTAEYMKLQDTKLGIEQQYDKQWAAVCEICPVATATTARKTAINVMCDLVRCYQQYKEDPHNRFRDGIYTDEELQVLFRTTTQNPEVTYRLGWVLACNEAKLGLDDPRWKRRMTNAQCKILDHAFRFAAKQVIEREKVHVPDLEADGRAGEFDPIHTDDDGEVSPVEDLFKITSQEVPVEMPTQVQ